jgi:hypothetical protein
MNHNDLFAIDATSGLITLHKTSQHKLDRELIGDTLNLTILASDSNSHPTSSLTSQCQVAIRVLDVNDNGPKFARDSYYVSLQEDAPVDFAITRLTAQDPDSPPHHTQYYLDDGNEKLFRINSSTGDIYVNAPLDYERQMRHELRVTAVDAELNEYAKTKLFIDLLDVNDNAPVFVLDSNTTLTLDEQLPEGTLVYTFNATDSDNNSSMLRYRLVSLINSNEKSLFDLNEITGELRLGRVYDYDDRDEAINVGREFFLQIECSDEGLPRPLTTQANLTVIFRDINDNAPQFTRKNQTLIIKGNQLRLKNKWLRSDYPKTSNIYVAFAKI